ncbi:MAG: family 16 glycosylhydrolase [Chitinophagaceae bacterium]|nr:family 16 glycosylhydrolase [Chitinophagaceae bacterium]
MLVGLPLITFSQNTFVNTISKKTTSLNGSWNYIIDPYETGYYGFHGDVYDQTNPKATSAFYNNYHAKDKLELVEYDFDKSLQMKIPADWNTQSEKLFYYEGTVWFKKSFDYFLKKGKRLFVYFGAVNYKAEVYLNGTKLGVHEGGFTPFDFEVTGIVKEKNNYLIVKVDNKRLKQAVPTTNTDWWNYGGITRDVLLLEETDTYIKDYTIQLKKNERKIIEGSIQLSNALQPEKIVIKIPELNITKDVLLDAAGNGNFEITVASTINYWSPEKPKLYNVIIESSYQTIKDEIGFRSIETRGADIVLNGKPIFLSGICMHEEINGRRANTEADAKKLLTWAKELGCNYVRLAHYPHNENMLKMADKMGLLVWEEIPVYWTIDFTNTSTLNNAKNQLTEVIRRDKNRASVIIWSVANETPLSKSRNEFLLNLINHAKALDNTRLISAALLTRGENGVEIIDDKIGEHLDIVSFNQYRGWYGGDLKTAPDAKWATPYCKPVIVSEFGGDAKQGLHGTINERWTEEYQEYLYKQNLLMIEKMPNIRGISPWILTDFRSPRRNLPNIQDGFNRKGLISDTEKKKKAFFVLQDFYKKIKTAYISNSIKSWELVWSDEFNNTELPDSTNWGYDIGGHGWGNNELQYYTKADTTNAIVKNGKLYITAHKQTKEKNNYTSARLVSKNKAEFKYGRFEISAKLPAGRGTWPAIWMLGKNLPQTGWPLCGEIDIMEHVGYNKDSIFGTIHSKAYNHMIGTQKGKGIFITNPYTQFHVYAIEWTQEKIDFMVDNVVYNHIENEHLSTNEWPFDQPFYFLLNLAVGGGWGGKMGVDETVFPATMEIDYVRVFQTK